jgi:polyhydroxybutyrate depolymerase
MSISSPRHKRSRVVQPGLMGRSPSGSTPIPPFTTRSLPVAISMVLATMIVMFQSVDASAGTRARRNTGTTHTIRVGGLDRVYIASGRITRRNQPLVIQLHGGGGSGATFERLTGLGALGARDGFIVASPNGIGKNWNDGRTDNQNEATLRNVDDVAFLDALIEDAAKRYSIDRSQVFVVGMSNGAFMANRYACERADRVVGIGLVAGTMSPELQQSCRPSRPVRVIDFHGTADPLVPIGGGAVAENRGSAISVDAMMQTWVSLNGCTKTPAVRVAAPVTITRWGCAPTIVAYRIEGAGHVWPGGGQYAPVRVIGRATDALDASSVMWDFFQRG